MDNPDAYPKTILDGCSFRAVWRSPDVLVIRSKRQWWMIALGILLLAVVSFGLFVAAMATYAEILVAGRLPLMGLVCVVVAALRTL